MNSRNTWLWFGLAVGLFLFIFFFERHWSKPMVQTGGPGKLLTGYQPGLVTGFQVRRGRQFVHLRREGDAWRLSEPLVYPANPVVVDTLLQQLEKLDRRVEIVSAKLADFGLADPAAIVVLFQGDTRLELQVGALTPTGDQVYVRAVGVEGIYTADAGLLNSDIPSAVDAWRSHALLTAGTSQAFDRLEVRSTNRSVGFSLQYNATNRAWRLSKPMLARASKVKAEKILLDCLQARVVRFVSDDPAVEAEPYGFQPPDLELVLGVGTNDWMTVQFGKSPTNDPALVYARRMSHTNLVLVRRDLLESLRTPFTELRDRHLFTFDPKAVQQIEVLGENPFIVRQQTNHQWRVVEPQDYPADFLLVRDWLTELYGLEVAGIEKEVVMDYSAYGLATPLREVFLKAVATNSAALTNYVISSAAIGTNAAGKYFGRRGDENSVFNLEEADYYRLSQQGWQLRDRRIWSFLITNVVRLTLRQGGLTTQLVRNGTNDWSFAAGSQGIKNDFAVEESVVRLGELTAIYWLERGEAARQRNGFTDASLRMEIEVREGERLQLYQVEFGPERPGRALACVTLDGQPWIFEYPWPIYQMLTRELPLPKPPPTTGK